MALRRIIYSSKATKHFGERELLDILHDARAFNSIDNITGVLMHKNGTFVQVIEGEPDVVEDLFNRIKLDKRHSNIKIITDTSAASRIFPNWAMGCADFNRPELSLIPGIRTDLNNPEVIKEIISRLPEIAELLKEYPE